MSIRPFRIDVPEQDLTDLQQRLARTRWTPRLPDDDGRYGVPEALLRDLIEHWRDHYDWRAQETRLNQWQQGLATAAGEQVHFFHAPSPEPDAVPLVLTHGWPGSPVEFMEVIGPLSDPRAHGGDPADAFHVVCPSMPGYGFSGPTQHRGVHINHVAEAIADLMQQLGYERYIAQGGDWGAVVTRRLGEAFPERLLGVHFNMLFAMPDDFADPAAWEGVTEAEMQAFSSAAEHIADGTGYMAIQGTRPDTLACALQDSPVGLAGWILEKFHAWTDNDGDLFSTLSRDQLLTNLMFYWLTNTAGSAARLYCESARAGISAADPWPGRVEVPTGFARYPRELLQTPRVWAERKYNLVHFAEMPRGGHFAAFEQPAAFVDDVRAFARKVR